MPDHQNRDSASATRARFDSHASSLKYAGALDDTPTHRRELRCIKSLMAGVPAGARVLDLPCGAGRLLPFLVGSGYRVFEADSSAHMIDRARELALDRAPAATIEFGVEDVLNTSFGDASFDAVICNRLFHRPEHGSRARVTRVLGDEQQEFPCFIRVDLAALEGGLDLDFKRAGFSLFSNDAQQ